MVGYRPTTSSTARRMVEGFASSPEIASISVPAPRDTQRWLGGLASEAAVGTSCHGTTGARRRREVFFRCGDLLRCMNWSQPAQRGARVQKACVLRIQPRNHEHRRCACAAFDTRRWLGVEGCRWTSHHGRVPKEGGLSPMRRPSTVYELITTSAARLARAESLRAAHPTPKPRAPTMRLRRA